MWSRVPVAVQMVRETLGEAYPVGGCVRDLLLGRQPGDWDVTTALMPEEVMALFDKTIPTGLAHGTVTVLVDGLPIEVTTHRKELGYSDGRHPDAVTFDATLLDDLSRRDFTINAMALAPDGTIIDPFGGQVDLAKGVIRCVGDPETRFREDGLRLLRCVRFAAQLGFEIEEHTLNALETCASALEAVSGERVKAELEKILLSKRPNWVEVPLKMGMLNRFGGSYRGDLQFGEVPPEPISRWSVLCGGAGLDIAKLPVERWLRRGILHPEVAQLEGLTLTGGDLYAMGYRGADISAIRRWLLDWITTQNGENIPEKLRQKTLEWQGNLVENDG